MNTMFYNGIFQGIKKMFIVRLQGRMVEQQDIKEQNQMLERENRDYLKELTSAREEVWPAHLLY